MGRLLQSTLICAFIVLCVSCDSRTEVEKATEQGILLLGNSNEPKSLDPHLVSGVIESNLLRSLFEGLCVEHPSDDSKALPGAATAWTANENFTEWVFTLQPDGKWSDGTPVTADDFVFAYHRILHPDFPSDYADMLYFIKNAEEYRKKTISDFSQVGVQAVDSHTLKLTLRSPTPFLPELTKHFTWLPVPRHLILKYGDMTTPFTAWTKEGHLVSNGTFQLKTWRQNHYIEVEKNLHYWDKDAVALNGIRFLPIKNTNTEARMFLDGQLHVSYTVPPDLITIAQKKHADELRQELYIGTRFVRCNVTRPFTADPNVRKALAYSIDRESLITNILQGGQQPAGSVTPPFGSYKPEAQVAFDPEQAREFLAKSDYHDPSSIPEIQLLTTDSDVQRRMAEALQAMWAEHLGIKVRLVQREWKSYLKMRNELEFDLLDGGWIGDYLDPTTYLDLWKAGNGNNNTGWGDRSYEAMLSEAELIESPEVRYQKLLEAESYVMDALPAIPVYHYTTNYFISSHVQNWHPLLLNNHPYKFISLNAEK